MLNLEQPLLGTNTQEPHANSACQAYTTTAGTIYLRDHCPPSFVEQLSADEGLHAFTRRSEREHELLLKIARSDTSKLALAHTDTGLIVGQITFADAGVWWQKAEVVREVALEVSANWRELGIARRLIELVMAREDLENWILLAMGLSWHWETEQLGLSRARYRELLARLVAPYNFVEYLTTEPNIRDDPSNILLARLGRHVAQTSLQQFYACLLNSETLPGM
ncbi:MAG TPA: hypothetical protein VGM01_06440 [Ktedonobacteraceae bacterium]|jgi:acetoin utilization protein AcuA